MARFQFLLAEGLYRSHGWGQYVMLLAAVAAVALAIGGFYFWNTYRKPRANAEEASPEDLFTELCNAHELSRTEQTLIVQLARTFELPQPAILFVEPWPFDRATEAGDENATRYSMLRQKLFGSLL